MNWFNYRDCIFPKDLGIKTTLQIPFMWNGAYIVYILGLCFINVWIDRRMETKCNIFLCQISSMKKKIKSGTSRLLNVLVVRTLKYSMSNLGDCLDCCRFFRQYFLLFVIHQMSLALFKFIASLGRNMIASQTFGSFTLLIVFVLGGFVVSRGIWHYSIWKDSYLLQRNILYTNIELFN